MKRIKWAVVLAAVLAIMFAGCTGPFDKDKYVGNPLVTGGKYLKVTGRANSWDGLDIRFGTGDNCVKAGDKVVVTTSGAGAIKLGSSGDPYGDIVSNSNAGTGPEGCKVFTIASAAAPNTGNIRIQADKGNDYNLYEIEVTRGGASIYKLSTELSTYDKGDEYDPSDSVFLINAGSPKFKVAR